MFRTTPYKHSMMRGTLYLKYLTRMLTVDNMMIKISSVSLTQKKMSSLKVELLQKERCLLVSKTKVPSNMQAKSSRKKCRKPVTGTRIPRSRGSLVIFATISISSSLYCSLLQLTLLHCRWIGTLLSCSRLLHLNPLTMLLHGFLLPRWSSKSLAWE